MCSGCNVTHRYGQMSSLHLTTYFTDFVFNEHENEGRGPSRGNMIHMNSPQPGWKRDGGRDDQTSSPCHTDNRPLITSAARLGRLGESLRAYGDEGLNPSVWKNICLCDH